MKITRIYLLLSFTPLLWCCNSSSSTSDQDFITGPLIQPHRISTINIPLNDGTQYIFQSGKVIINANGEEEYWGLDAANNSIIIFNLSTKIISKKIKINKIGPKAITNILNFHVHTADSVFIFPTNTGRIYLIDSEAEIIDKWNYQSLFLPNGEALSENFPFPMAELGTHFFFRKDKAYLILPLWLRGSGEFYKVPPLIHFDLKYNKVVNNFGEYPENYRGKEVSIRDHFNLVELNNGEILISFEESHFIQRYSPSGEFIEQFPAKSNFVDSFTLFKNYPDSQTRKNYWVENGFYIGLLYDHYRDLVYRIVSHGQDLKDINGRLNNVQMANWSIIILRPNGKVIGEAKFDGSKYRVNDGLYISKEGILASLENLYNDNNNEESLDFELIQFDIK